MQAAIEHLTAKEIHEDSDAAEEDSQPQVENLKHRGEDVRVPAEIRRSPEFADRVNAEQHQRKESQQIDPQPAPGEKGLLHFDAQDGGDLTPPQRIHFVGSSGPIKYS